MTDYMESCVILGTSRSGKSLLASMLGKAGYHFGESVYHYSATTSIGFLESSMINNINRDLLEEAYADSSIMKCFLYKFNWKMSWLFGQPQPLWLTDIWHRLIYKNKDRYFQRMRDAIGKRPFAINDPRFCYTLDAWHSALNPCKYVCVFRNPEPTANAIYNDIGSWNGSIKHSINKKKLLNFWMAAYSYILNYQYPMGGNWLFLHFSDLFHYERRNIIKTFLKAPIDELVLTGGLAEEDELLEHSGCPIYENLMRARNDCLTRSHI